MPAGGTGSRRPPQVLTLALTSKAPKVIDADGITQLGDPGRTRGQDAILTPHEGEFRKLFGELPGTKPERAWKRRRVGRGHRLQGPGHFWSPCLTADWASRHRPRPGWRARGPVMSSSGIVAAIRARGLSAFEAACAGVWLHGRAAEIAGPAMIADDLVEAIPAAIASPVNELVVRIAARGDGVTAADAMSLRRAWRRLARRWRAGVRAASSGAALPAFPRMRWLPAPACRRRGLSRLSRVARGDGARPARSCDIDSAAVLVTAAQPAPGDAQGAEGRPAMR